ncbi:hypothetical protein DFJ74DRAFT_752115, partial [Hyaloraphidium curvatum]
LPRPERPQIRKPTRPSSPSLVRRPLPSRPRVRIPAPRPARALSIVRRPLPEAPRVVVRAPCFYHLHVGRERHCPPRARGTGRAGPERAHVRRYRARRRRAGHLGGAREIRAAENADVQCRQRRRGWRSGRRPGGAEEAGIACSLADLAVRARGLRPWRRGFPAAQERQRLPRPGRAVCGARGRILRPPLPLRTASVARLPARPGYSGRPRSGRRHAVRRRARQGVVRGFHRRSGGRRSE